MSICNQMQFVSLRNNKVFSIDNENIINDKENVTWKETFAELRLFWEDHILFTFYVTSKVRNNCNGLHAAELNANS